MCGRYRLSRRKQIVADYFYALPDGDDEWEPRYNIAPSQPVPVVRVDPKKKTRSLSLLRWGLIPSWATDPNVGFKSINARAETVTTTASFRDPLRAQRCLIPADGFYEWKRSAKSKQPYCFEIEKGALFAFAGLWDRWADVDGKVLETCTILTTSANSNISGIHDRMPIIIPPEEYERWLATPPAQARSVLNLLAPYAGYMRHYPVSERVNQVLNDDVQCSEPIKLDAPTQGNLFS
jgi:putative SOS response-associated peptidase YedK